VKARCCLHNVLIPAENNGCEGLRGVSSNLASPIVVVYVVVCPHSCTHLVQKISALASPLLREDQYMRWHVAVCSFNYTLFYKLTIFV